MAINTISEVQAILPFDLAEATRYLAERDERLKELIEAAAPFQIDGEEGQSPYEVLVEAIVYLSISG